MAKLLLSSFLSFLILITTAQNTPPLNLPKDAKIDGSIVDMRTRQPKNNELIVFKSHKNANEYQATSNELGKFTTRLPAGDKYDIFVMGFKDSTSYNILDIPALGANSYYKNPFNVNIEFDPPKTFVLDNVEFDFGKATLRAEAYKTLDDLADFLQRKSDQKIEIGGHTDNVGTETKNKILSLERAKSIVTYLISKGISAERLTSKGYGSMEPIEENNTEAGRQKNRRTEVKILD
jgi:outer membrane protein OmpA-like peptidoglycan-associated protein